MSNSVEQVIAVALELRDDEHSLVAGGLLDSPGDLPGLNDQAEDFLAELARRSGEREGAVACETLRDEHPAG